MPTQLVLKIDAAGKDAWPAVKLAMEVVDRSLQEVSGIAEDAWPRVEHYINNGNEAARKRRKVCEETVWALARLGWLRTGGEREVIEAAMAFVLVDEDASETEFVTTEQDLVRVVQALPDFPPQEDNR